MPTRRRILPGWIPLLITVFSTTGAVILLSRQLTAQSAEEQAIPSTASSVTAFPIQIAPGFDGIVLVDNQNRNMCIYQYKVRNPAHERLTLLATRNFQYDLQLEDYNNADPRPATVKEWLQRNSGRTHDPVEPVRDGAEQKSAPFTDAQSPTNDKPAWRTPEVSYESPKETTPTSDEMGDMEQKTENSAQNLIKPPVLPSKVFLKCANPDCDFFCQLSSVEFINAVNLQLSQIRYHDPQRYAKLQASTYLAMPELNNADEKEIDPAVAYQMIQVKLIENWGQIDRKLGLTCVRCGKDEVYRAIECKRCKGIYLPQFDLVGQSAYKCPKCQTINAPAPQEKPGISDGTIHK